MIRHEVRVSTFRQTREILFEEGIRVGRDVVIQKDFDLPIGQKRERQIYYIVFVPRLYPTVLTHKGPFEHPFFFSFLHSNVHSYYKTKDIFLFLKLFELQCTTLVVRSISVHSTTRIRKSPVGRRETTDP